MRWIALLFFVFFLVVACGYDETPGEEPKPDGGQQPPPDEQRSDAGGLPGAPDGSTSHSPDAAPVPPPF